MDELEKQAELVWTGAESWKNEGYFDDRGIGRGKYEGYRQVGDAMVYNCHAGFFTRLKWFFQDMYHP